MRPFTGKLSFLDKMLVIISVGLCGIFLFGAFILDLLGMPVKPHKAAGYEDI